MMRKPVLIALRRARMLFAIGASVGPEQYLDGGQPNDYMNSRCPIRMVKTED